ncbi:pilin [Piscinibacter sp.]|jgi:type IV pilus assembly protein PilA|uniref:pilin n=1 Tax=Piscinibacter sp. TaxID=1903157 RepID=UPI002F40B5A2
MAGRAPCIRLRVLRAKRKRHPGFTLIELMVVIAVIAILAMLALPNFQHQIVREQVAEALPLADIAKAPVAASWSNTRTFPADNASAGLPSEDRIVNNVVSAVAVQAGAIHITFGNRANALLKGKILTLRPAVVEDAPIVPVTWVCGYASGPGRMTIQGENRTNIPRADLPLKCRSV